MSFLSIFFLWSGILLIVPILIAFWSKRKFRKEKFGAFYLLRRVSESTKKRIRLLQLLKLLNRLILMALVVLIFSEPLQTVLRLQKASNGFAILLETSRSLQMKSGELSLAELQVQKAKEVLREIPPEARGLILTADRQCEALSLSDGRQAASSEDWLKELSVQRIPYSNQAFTSGALTQCSQRLESIFSGEKVLSFLISTLPQSIDLNMVKAAGFQMIPLEVPQLPPLSKDEVSQKMEARSVELSFDWNSPKDLSLIYADSSMEALGKVESKIELSAQRRAWLWIKANEATDPWENSQILSLRRLFSSQVTLWAEKESEGYLSLYAALRSHPQIEVIRQVGGMPKGSTLMIYGPFSQSLPAQAERIWFFSSFDGASYFPVRDRKQWTAQVASDDVRQSFEISSSEGSIFIRRYSLLDLQNLQVLETFLDGAPSLLERLESNRRIWVSPFDLEDLTTDLTLEPSFIPYLYRHLDRWLGSFESLTDSTDLPPIWLMPGSTPAHPASVRNRDWPGIYGDASSSTFVSPLPLERNFHSLENQETSQSSLAESKESIRDKLYPFLALSVLIELLFCILSAKWGLFALCFFISAFAYEPLRAQIKSVQQIPLAAFRSMDEDRFRSLQQFVQEASLLSNLDFAAPERLSSVSDIWKYSVVFGGASEDFENLNAKEAQSLRDYLDRGGLIVFDDPLAMKDSQFYRQVKVQMQKILPGRSFEVVSRDAVVFRTFYLLQEVSGRKLSASHIEGIQLDGRWVVLYSFNDLLGAILRKPAGDYALSVTPYGVMQRRLSKRLLLNFLMYSVTVDYKDDAIHLPHILKRRVR